MVPDKKDIQQPLCRSHGKGQNELYTMMTLLWGPITALAPSASEGTEAEIVIQNPGFGCQQRTREEPHSL